MMQLIIACLILMVIMDVFYIIRGIKKKQAIFEIKRSINGIVLMLATIMAVYIIIGGAVISPYIVKWAENYQFTSEMNSFGVWLVKDGTIIAWVVFVVTLSVLTIVKFTTLLKYNDKEKAWIKETRDKFINKVPKSLRWVFK